jgi:hypothetical protein
MFLVAILPILLKKIARTGRAKSCISRASWGRTVEIDGIAMLPERTQEDFGVKRRSVTYVRVVSSNLVTSENCGLYLYTLIFNQWMSSDQLVQTALAILGPSCHLAVAEPHHPVPALGLHRLFDWPAVLVLVGMAHRPMGVGLVAVVCALVWLKWLWVHWLVPRPSSRLAMLALAPDGKLK